MAKKLFLAILLSVFTSYFVNAQILHTQWKFSSKKVSACEYDLIFTISIDKGWHIPAATKIKGTEGEVFPTEITFKTSKDYTLVGAITETKPKSEYDPTIGKKVLVHYNNVTFTQRVKLHSSSKLKVTGSYQYQLCNENSCTYPPKEDFSFDVQGTPACKINTNKK